MIILGDVKRLHVRVDIDESDIPCFQKNTPAYATLKGRPDVLFPLKFVYVEPYVIPKQSLTGSNSELVDTRVLQVIYALPRDERPGPPVRRGTDGCLHEGGHPRGGRSHQRRCDLQVPRRATGGATVPVPVVAVTERRPPTRGGRPRFPLGRAGNIPTAQPEPRKRYHPEWPRGLLVSAFLGGDRKPPRRASLPKKRDNQNFSLALPLTALVSF